MDVTSFVAGAVIAALVALAVGYAVLRRDRRRRGPPIVILDRREADRRQADRRKALAAAYDGPERRMGDRRKGERRVSHRREVLLAEAEELEEARARRRGVEMSRGQDARRVR